MAFKASTWALLGPALWIAVLLLVASGKADGAIETTQVAGSREVVLEKTAFPSALECVRVVQSDSRSSRIAVTPLGNRSRKS